MRAGFVAAGWLAVALSPWTSRAAEPGGPQPAGSVPAPDAGVLDERLVEEITVRAPTRLPDSRPPGDGLAVQIIDSEELRSMGARTLQEALQRIPGVHLSDEQGNPHQMDLSLRGFSASPVTGLPQGISLFVDGVRVNEPAVEEVNFELVPLADVERVEIVRGPNAIFGRNTLGGAIHIVTRRGGSRPEARIQVEGGSWDYQEARGFVAGPLGPLDGYLSLGEFSDRGWRIGGAGRGVRALGKLGLRRADANAALSYQFQRDRLEQPGSLPLPMLVTDRRQNFTPGDFFQPTLHLVTLNGRNRLAPGLSLGLNGFFRALDSEQYNASLIGPDTRLTNHTLSAGAAIQLDHLLRKGVLRNQLTAGAEATRNSVLIRVREQPNSRFPSEGGVPLPRLASDLSDSQLALGAFLQDQVRVAEGPLAGLGATAAVRFDRIVHRIMDSSPDDPGKATGNAAFHAWVPAVGLTWTFAPRWLASVSWSSGFRAPAFLELTCADPTAPCVGLQAGVAPDTSLTLLRPVRSRSLEAGLSAAFLESVTATLSLFRADLHNDIYSVASPGTTRVFFQNIGDTRRTGFELALRFERGAVEAEAGYAYSRATFEGDLVLATPRTPDGTEAVRSGAQLPLTPNHHLRLEVRAATLSWLTVSAGFEYVGSQYFRGDEANLAPKLAPHLLLRAGADLRWRGWTATLRAVNLLDTRYETFGTFAPDGRFPGRPIEPFLTPGSPIRIVLGLRWELEEAAGEMR